MTMEELIQQKLRFIFKDDNIIFNKSRFAGGLTNYNYIIKIHGIEYVVRQPGNMTDMMIDRKVESINNKIASEFGVNSECIYFDEHSGIKVSIFIKNSKNIAFANPCSEKNVRSVSYLMKKIHSSPKSFPNKFDWEAELTKYEQIIEGLRGEFFFDYFILKDKLLEFIQKNIKDKVFVPCHNDTVPENFILDESGRTYLIDWEYSGMNDPAWDVAAYILESRLSEDAIKYLFSDYYDGFLSKENSLKIKSYMMAQDLLWTIWALIRHYSGDDFLAYCSFRYERFKKNLNKTTDSPDYPISEMVND